MVDAEQLQQAWDRAQAAFAVMLAHKTYADQDHPLTKAYVAAERAVDEVLIDLQWEKTKAEFDALQGADSDFAGDHHVYPAGVGR